MLICRLGADPEVKQTKNGDNFANLSLATNKKFKDFKNNIKSISVLADISTKPVSKKRYRKDKGIDKT